MNRARALVTGGTGFVGTHLVRALEARGVQVTILSRGTLPVPVAGGSCHVAGDVRSHTDVEAAARGVAVIFHLAAWNGSAGAGHGTSGAAVNVDGTKNVLVVARRAGAQVVYFSSAKAAGDHTDPGAQVDEYGQSRLGAENLVRMAASDGQRVVGFRMPMVWGIGHRGNLFRMTHAIARGRFPPLPTLSNRRSLVHVDDVVRAAIELFERGVSTPAPLTVTDGRSYSGREIYDKIRAALQLPPARWRVPLVALRTAGRLGDIAQRAGLPAPMTTAELQKLVASAHYEDTLSRAGLGAWSRVSLDDGLPSFVSWYRSLGLR